jgi:hypothetical protein
MVMKPWHLQRADRAWRRAKTAEKISFDATQGLNANEDSVFLLEVKCFLLTFLFIGLANHDARAGVTQADGGI